MDDRLRGPAPGPGPQLDLLQHRKPVPGGRPRRLRDEHHQEQHGVRRPCPDPGSQAGPSFDLEGEHDREERKTQPGGQAGRKPGPQRGESGQAQQHTPGDRAQHPADDGESSSEAEVGA
ncbi:hypothetical protein SLV14_007496 [Streptomyces sp. Je 1-4]|nr:MULTISPECIES: hypothetical protein [unclassified Streptomyces]UYB44409.1 hypothetical protein SLV14_007496 [Streptomyces sp. Je 1-4]UZQ40864.1 hypothetical protein SLV14N_007496 [Streptomyces sp. Je 1-4] [Streptomyces sp. Je 1-4 4N24]UZQ48281.1 hypothetical protein SLV14NA_007496 [Streptomyces sp. Je 1-4] [Streptomyces sp. Je 1-4 4N24_ara]